MTRSPLSLAARCACASVLTTLCATTVAAAQIPGGGSAQPGAGVGGTALSRAAHAPELPRYTVLELGVPDGFTTSRVTALDADGGGYGYAAISPPPPFYSSYLRPVRYAPDGQAVDLPTLVSDPSGDIAVAWRGDDLGLAVGFAPGPSGWTDELTRVPYAWAGDVPLKLDLELGYAGEAFDANESGRIVGYVRIYDEMPGAVYPAQATVWDGVAGTGTTLVSLDEEEDSEARAVNASGQVCGTSAGQAVRWDAPGLPPVILGGPPGATNSSAQHLNAAGDVVGHATVGGIPVAFLHEAASGVTQALDPLPGWSKSDAVAVNARRQVVGYAYEGSPYFDPKRGVLWQGGVVRVLDDLLVPAQASLYAIGGAWDINDAGQIVASATRLSDGASLSVRLDPVTPGS